MTSKNASLIGAIVALAVLCSGAFANITVTLSPPRADVSLLVYGNTDLTVARETRPVALPAGESALTVAWPGAAIDATSIRIVGPEGVTVSDATQPPGKRDQLSWTVTAAQAGPADLEITYFTSGIEWKPLYRLVVNEGTGEALLEGSITLKNRSGQTFENARVQLVVGELKLVENLAEAAWKALPANKDVKKDAPPASSSGLSERYLCDLGTLASIPQNDSVVIPFIAATTVPARPEYRLHDAKHKGGVHRILIFENTGDFGLGDQPLAAADARVAEVGAEGLIPRGVVRVPYTPVGEECEIDLGVSTDVVAKRRVMRKLRTNIEFDRFRKVEGYDQRESVTVEINNWSIQPVT
ncbi:MAG TPA: hypothetical protein QGH10_01700, partial [Armatimonadota bacterium]|nr:hypothetical protein [Armatimonadota bacterium]